MEDLWILGYLDHVSDITGHEGQRETYFSALRDVAYLRGEKCLYFPDMIAFG